VATLVPLTRGGVRQPNELRCPSAPQLLDTEMVKVFEDAAA
jgi:hypothetical protein